RRNATCRSSPECGKDVGQKNIGWKNRGRKSSYFPVLCFSVWSLIAILVTASPQLTREEIWRGDLQYLFAELPKRHKNLFFKINPQQFDREIAGIIEAVPTLSDSQIKLALRRLMAMIGDPHTRISFNVDKTYPITLYQFS